MKADPVRLLVLTTSYPNRSNPASGVFVRRLLEHLPPLFSILVIAPDTDRADAFKQSKSIRIRPFCYAPRRLQVLAHRPGGLSVLFKRKFEHLVLLPGFLAAAVLNLIRETRRSDLIHAQWTPGGVIAGLVGALMQRPVITTVRGTDFNWADSSVVFRLVLRCCLYLNQNVVTVSRGMAKQLMAGYPRHCRKIRYIPNGVTLPEKGVVERRSTSSFLVAVIGNLIPAKRVDVVIRAFQALTRSVTDARLLVAGDGPERKGLETFVCRSGLQPSVSFLGVLQPGDIRKLLQACHALVLASAKEGRPNIILEAMAAGTPVVAADIEPVREIIGHNERGLLFPLDDVEQLASRLRFLREDAAAGSRMAQQAFGWLEKQGLTWQKTADAYSALYRQVLAQYRQGKAGCAG